MQTCIVIFKKDCFSNPSDQGSFYLFPFFFCGELGGSGGGGGGLGWATSDG